MSRLTDALTHLAGRGGPGDPAAVLDAARHRAAQMRRHRRAVVGVAAAALVLVVGIVSLDSRPDGDRVGTESGLAGQPSAPPAPGPTPGPAPTSPDDPARDGAPASTAPADAETSPSQGRASVQVFFTAEDHLADGCSATTPVTRTVEAPAVLRGALEELLRGPTRAERAAGLQSPFSAETAGGLVAVSIVEGVALVDLRPDLVQALGPTSAACAGAVLVSQLDATVTQFPQVERAVYSYGGDVAAFYAGLEGVAPDGSSTTPEADGVPAWPGSVTVMASGEVDLDGFDAHLAAADPRGSLGPGAVASLLLHLEDQRAAGVLVHVEDLASDRPRVLAVTLSRLGDDSVRAIRYELRIDVTPGEPARVTSATWSQRCHPGRGQQDFAAALCV